MQTWIVANQKGGVGKTTTVVSMAAALAQRGQRVLMIDLDPHGSLTTYFGMDESGLNASVYNLFQDTELHVGSLISATRFDNLWLMPSASALVTLDRQLGAQLGKGTVLRQALTKVRDGFDYVLIDCAPTLGILMINALAAGNLLVLPVQTEFLALKGLERMLVTLSMVNKARGTPIPLMIVPTMFDRRTKASRDALSHLQEKHGEQLWELVIPIDTQFRDASKAGIPLPFLQAGARGALAYESLVDTLMDMTGFTPAPVSKESEAYE